MHHRVDIQAILRDPQKKQALIAGVVQFMASHEGRDLSRAEADKIASGECREA